MYEELCAVTHVIINALGLFHPELFKANFLQPVAAHMEEMCRWRTGQDHG